MAHDTYASLIEGVMPPKMRDDVRRTEDAERAADELRQYEDRENAWAKQLHAENQAHALEYITGHTAQERYWIAMNTTAKRDARDINAEYGSAQRMAILIDGREMKPREIVQAEQQQAAGQQQQEVRGREFMSRMISELDGRRAAERRQAEDDEIARLEELIERDRREAKLRRAGYRHRGEIVR